MLQSVPKEQWGEVRLKGAAIEGINGRKKEMGLRRRWEGDYLTNINENKDHSLYLKGVSTMKDTAQVLFSSFMKKMNKRGKMEERVLVVSNSGITKFSSKFK